MRCCLETGAHNTEVTVYSWEYGVIYDVWIGFTIFMLDKARGSRKDGM